MTQTKCLVITNYYYYLKVLILYLAVLLSVRLRLGFRETTIFVDPGSGVSLVTLLSEVGQVDIPVGIGSVKLEKACSGKGTSSTQL